MSEICECPGCATKLRLPAGAAKAKCPNCKLVFASSPRSSANPQNGLAQTNQSAQRPVARVSPSRTQVPAAAAKPKADNRPQLRCPKCQMLMKVPAGAAGQSVRCPSCKATLKVPNVAGLAGTPTPSQPAIVRPNASTPVALASSTPAVSSGFTSLPEPAFASSPSMPAYASPPAMQRQSPYQSPSAVAPQRRSRPGGWQDWFVDSEKFLILTAVVSLVSLLMSSVPVVGWLFMLAIFGGVLHHSDWVRDLVVGHRV